MLPAGIKAHPLIMVESVISYPFCKPINTQTIMKTCSKVLAIPFLLVALMTVPGCGEPKPASMTEGVEMSEIEAYEAAQKKMEADSMGEMDDTDAP